MSRIDSLIINNTEYRLNVNRISNLQTTINSLQTTINSLTNRIDSLEEGDSIGSIQLTLYEKNNNYCYITVQTSNVSNRNNIKYYTMSGNRNNHTEQNITSYVTYVTGNNNDFRVQVSTARLSSDDFGNFGWYNDPTLTNRWNIRAEVTDNFGNNISYKLFIDDNDTQQIKFYTVTFDGFDSSNASSMSVPEGFEITLPTSATKDSDSQYEYSFNGWKNNSTNTTYSPGSKVTINGNTTFTAQFTRYDKSILEVIYDDSMGEVVQLENPQDTNGTHVINGWWFEEDEGTWLYFKAEPENGYSFSHWLYDEAEYTTNNLCALPKNSGTHILQAVFVDASYIDDTSYTYIGDIGDYFDQNGHGYIDLGLPSGTLWASMNIGAGYVTDYGLYFQWGDTQGYTSNQVGTSSGKKAFNWADYKFNPSGDGSTFTKYTGSDGKTELDLVDDAARANWGGDWHMPTKEQIQELHNYTNNDWTSLNGVVGRLFTSKENGNTLFFPAAGHAGYGHMYGVGSYCTIWSSSLGSASVSLANNMHFDDADIIWDSEERRLWGYSVRPVLGNI